MKALLTSPLFWAFLCFTSGAVSSSVVVLYVFGLGDFFEVTNEGLLGYKVSDEGLACMALGAAAGGAFFARQWMFSRSG